MGERLDRVREQLTQVLNKRWHESTLTDADVTLLCEQIGLFPVPPTPATRLRALAIYAARALPLLNGEPVEDEDRAHNFARWCEAVDAGEDAVRAGSILLGFWSYSDAKSLGAS